MAPKVPSPRPPAGGSLPFVSWRASRSGDVEALYLGDCRVGYTFRSGEGWLWSVELLRPEGGHTRGRAATREAAHEAQEDALGDWLRAAGLVPARPE